MSEHFSLPTHLDAADRERLRLAVALLEKDSLVTILGRLAGRPVSAILDSLPSFVDEAIRGASQKAIVRCVEVALRPRKQRSLLAMAANYPALISGVAGAVGGFAGWAGLAVELPLTTIVMFQSISRIAEEEGEDLSSPEAVLACLEVFALSDDGRGPAASQSGYYAARSALTESLDAASGYLVRRGTATEAGPALMQFVSSVAARFGVLVSEELAASAVPLIGAVTASSLNVAFALHFNNIAKGHFTVRALERKYGDRLVREQFELDTLSTRRDNSAWRRSPDSKG